MPVKQVFFGFCKKLKCSRENIGILRPFASMSSSSDKEDSQLKLSDFQIDKHEYLADSYSVKKRIRKKYLKHENTIGHIDYSVQDGNIWSMYVSNDYRRKGLGTQILNDAVSDIKDNGINEIYLLARKNHEFWNNVYDGRFQYDKKRSLEYDRHGIGYFVLNLDDYVKNKFII